MLANREHYLDTRGGSSVMNIWMLFQPSDNPFIFLQFSSSVSESDFDREVLQADRPVLVDFWASWSAPCRMVAPALEALARDQAKTLKVVKVNVDENPGLASRYRAMSIPTMIVFKGGREVDRWVGAQSENVIRSRIARWI